MNNNHSVFYSYVESYVSQNPECAANIATFVQRGISSALMNSQQRAADFECTTLMLLRKRFGKGEHDYVLDKIKKWNGKSSLQWDDQIKQMEDKNVK
jgi:hypothetical protein